MSDDREPGTDDLERRLDAAFQTTRPRRGFEDELWARLQARRPWWERLGDGLRHVPRSGVAAGLVTVALVGLVVSLVRVAGPPRIATSAPAPASNRQSAAAAAPAPISGLPFGPLPAPAGAGATQGQPAGGQASLPAGTQRVDAGAASLPSVPPSLAVFRFVPGSGPANGTVLDPDQLPIGLRSGFYPSRQPSAALAAAAAAGSGQPVVLAQVRLAYVAVVSGGQGYLEPVYVCTGTAGSGPGSAPVQLVLSALDPAALR